MSDYTSINGDGEKGPVYSALAGGENEVELPKPKDLTAAKDNEPEEEYENPEEVMYDATAALRTPAGDEYDRTPDYVKKDDKDLVARVSHSWKSATILVAVYGLFMLLLFFILEYSEDNGGQGTFCGPAGVRVMGDGKWFTDCFREAIFFGPYAAMLFTFFIFYMTEQPWFQPWVKRPKTRFFWVTVLSMIGMIAAPIVRLLIRGFSERFSRDDDPGVLSASDVVQVAVWLLAAIIMYFDWSAGVGHRMFLRIFVWASAVDGVVNVGSLYVDMSEGFEIVDLFYPISMFCSWVLAVQMYQGFKDGRYELYGDADGRTKHRKKGFPPLNHVWDLMKDDSFILSIGFIMSASQGILLSFALLRTSDLMGGEIQTRAEADSALGALLQFSFAVAISTMVQQAIFGVSGQRVKRRMKERMFKNFLLQDAAFLHQKENDTGLLCSRLLTDTERFGTAVTTQLSNVMRPLSQAVIGTIFLFAINWRLTSVVLLMGIMVMIFSIVRSNLVTVKYSRMYSDELAKTSSRGVEVIKGLECVHQYMQEKNEHQSFLNVLQRVYNVGVNKEVRESIFEGTEHLLLATVGGTALWYGVTLCVNKEMNPDDLTGFALIAAAVVQSLENIMKIVPEFLDVSGPALRVCELINSKVTWDFDKEEGGAIPASLEGKIDFDKITFWYPGAKKKTLGPGLSFHIRGGESVALVGESGCGKSTAISLVQRQYHVRGLVDGCKPRDAGAILVDGQDIRSLNRRWVAERVGVVAQKATIWNTNILENVAYGDANERFVADGTPAKERQKERVIQALKQAAAWNEFVNPDPPLRPDGSKPEPGLGLNFMVGEDGSNLSGGQKQRVSIARMLYKNPSLLIFDEVTSALDAGSEKNVMKTLIDISKGKTCLMIAHRLNTIKHADHIIVLSKSGNIIEEAISKREGDSDVKVVVNGDADSDILGLSVDKEKEQKHGAPAKANTAVGIRAGSEKLNPDAPVLVYAHDQLLKVGNGYYKRMWDNQTF